MPDANGEEASWLSVEHYYQAQKFAGVSDAIAEGAVRGIREAKSPEEAARIGRALERLRPDLVSLKAPLFCQHWRSEHGLCFGPNTLECRLVFAGRRLRRSKDGSSSLTDGMEYE